MFCVKCGGVVDRGLNFCGACGQPVSVPSPQAHEVAPIQAINYPSSAPVPPSTRSVPYDPPQVSGMAIAALVSGIFIGVVGIILGFIAKNEISKSNGKKTGDGIATAAIVISIINMAVGLLLALD